ncbi:Peroxisomal membrane protein PEX25 [Wickerhamomyces ciferrii]|uniref:Peroxisomal membrane protein PEX25 n=1 Tax=Wickerhamomyces ciferrii (strain ATCC 14091 / BCRC 22168 / CBS 111 / JCM 3599 / NBRC 0793 / NRRL Y-1031 F-60-10) TaxID=1206466 RepID=K0KH30_WICCF|nr:Peroxisomal membrane protein PEX25 [Wickerhamomyces ciferrii]CCH44520.1 Peroxisomal membrane protein PEX25 [Wickerhamomyces ciferrii]
MSMMDSPSRVINESNIFSDSHYLNLKLQSPSPQSLSFDSNGHELKNIQTSPFKSPKKNVNHDAGNDDNDDVIENDEITIAKEIQNIGNITNIDTKKFDIFKALLGKLAGKDKLAKVLQYVLNLIKFYLTTSRRFLINEKFDNLSLDPKLLFKTPITYGKLLIFLNSTILEKKIFEVTKNISIFRQILRFGGTSYRIREFFNKFNTFIKAPSINQFQSIYLNEGALGDFIDLYYGICDEIVLLYKLGVFTNPNFKSFISKHEAYSWYADIMLGIKKNYVKLNENKNKQLKLSIQHQVKQKAQLLSRKLIENINGNSPMKSQILREFNNKSPSSPNSNTLNQELATLKHEEYILQLDIVRLSFDFVCDTIDIFNLNLNPAVYLISGTMSGLLGLKKVWSQTKRELEGQ